MNHAAIHTFLYICTQKLWMIKLHSLSSIAALQPSATCEIKEYPQSISSHRVSGPEPYLLVHLHSLALVDPIAQPIVNRVLPRKVLRPQDAHADLVSALPNAGNHELGVIHSELCYG